MAACCVAACCPCHDGCPPLLPSPQHEQTKGQAVSLLRVSAEESVDISVRQVASISFKNLVRRSWEPDESEWYLDPSPHMQLAPQRQAGRGGSSD